MNLQSLQPHFRGEILTPESPGYDGARRIWNSMIDRRPAAIVRCTGPADVLAAVRFAVDEDIYPAVRAGGHNVAGLATVEGGLVIDVTPMKGIVVDPIHGTATAQTGLTWGAFDRETHLYGLATTGGVVSTTGIAGLTLGGGVGSLASRCGLVCDNTLEYDVVNASGELMRVDANQHPDLFWALKGGGGNFGVVTSIRYRMHPISTVISGMIVHPISRGTEVLRFYRDVVEGLPDELTVHVGATTFPDGTQVMAMIPTYCGDNLDEGERLLNPLRTFGPPIADLVSRMPYPAAQQMFDGAVSYGLRSYWKSRYLSSLSDDAIETYLHFASTCPSPRTFMLIENSHGAVDRVSSNATAFSMRGQPFSLILMSLWENAQDDARNVEWTRGFHAAMHRWSAGAVYVNSLSEDDGGRVGEAYGRNYPRLCELKMKYDPGNRFRRNQNILPRAQAALG